MEKCTRRIAALLLVITFSILFTGCAMMSGRSEFDPPAKNDPVFVLGVFDVSEAGRWPDGLTIKRLKDAKEFTKSWRYKFKDKDVYVIAIENLSAGQYQLTKFNVDQGTVEGVFNLKDDRRFRLKLTRPGVHFIGSYKIHAVPPKHGIGIYRYELKTVRGPGEKEAIERLLQTAELKNQYWRDLLTKRLKQL